MVKRKGEICVTYKSCETLRTFVGIKPTVLPHTFAVLDLGRSLDERFDAAEKLRRTLASAGYDSC